MKVHHDSIFKNQSERTALPKLQAFPTIKIKPDITQASIKAKHGKSMAEYRMPTLQANTKLKMQSPILPKSTSCAILIQLYKEFKYDSHYNYFDLDETKKDDLCYNDLQTINHTLSLPMLQIRKTSLPQQTFLNQTSNGSNILVKGKSMAILLNPQNKENQTLHRIQDQQSQQNNSLHIPNDFHYPPIKFNIEVVPINEHPISTRMQCTIHYHMSRLFVIGGFGRKIFSHCTIYDTSQNKLTSFKSSLFKRSQHVSVRVGNFIVIHGGTIFESYGNRYTLSDTILFDTR